MVLVTVGFENNMIIQMSMTKLSLLCFVVVAVLSFPRNCQVFSPIGFDQCAACMRNYYLVGPGCAPCPTTRNSIRGCGSPSNEATDGNSGGNNNAGNATNNTNKTSGNVSSNVSVSTTNGSANGNTSSSINGTNGTNNGMTNGTNNGTTNGTNNGMTNGTNNGMTNGTNNGPISGTTNGNNVTVNSTSDSSNTNQTNSSSSSSNTTNSTNSPSTPLVNSTNSSSTSSTNPPPNKESSPPSASISDLTQIIFKLLPPKCCDFTVTPTLTCRGCEIGYYLTTNNTCEQTPTPSAPAPTVTPPANNPSSDKTIPGELKVTASLPTGAVTGTPLPIVVNQIIPSPTPQPIFVPISPPPTISPPPSSSRPNCPPNPYFDPTLAVMGRNCPCLCFQRFFYDFVQQQCLPVNPLCKTVGCQNECITCYIGYVLVNGKCVVNYGQITIASTSGASSLDSNCQTLQQNSTKCAVCNKRYYFNTNKGVCVAVDASCLTWDSTGFCTSCNPGFSMGINDKTCKALPSSSSLLDSSKCLKKVGRRCTACAFRYFLSNGLCLQVSDQCLTFHASFGYCTSCYGGYQLNDGVCEQSLPNCAVPAPSGCATCNPGYYSNDGECTPVSLYCNGSDPSTGFCLDCIFPYSLDSQTGTCFFSP